MWHVAQLLLWVKALLGAAGYWEHRGCLWWPVVLQLAVTYPHEIPTPPVAVASQSLWCCSGVAAECVELPQCRGAVVYSSRGAEELWCSCGASDLCAAVVQWSCDAAEL